MGGFKGWLVFQGIVSILFMVWGYRLYDAADTRMFGIGMMVGGVFAAAWCFGLSTVIDAIQRIEAKLGTTPHRKEKQTPPAP